MRRMKSTLALAAVAGTIALALPAIAKTVTNEPNWEAQPLYTTINVTAGFENDPRTISIDAGGEKSAEGLGEDCGGYINWDKPDVDVNYEAGDEKLSIYVKSRVDTTLVVYTPDRKWVCVDDTSDDNENPTLTFNNPREGNYNIWVGTYESGETKPATLYVSELTPPK